MRNIYRQSVLNKLSSPDRLDTMLYVVSPRLWMALGVIGLFIGAGILWSVFATLPITVDGFGVLTRAGSKMQVKATEKSAAQSILVDVGDEVAKDQPLIVLADKTQIAAPLAGRILARSVKVGDAVDVDTPLFTLESTDEATNPLQAVLYVNALDGQTIQSGMAVMLSPSTVRTAETGFLRGQVTDVQKSPVSPERFNQVIGSAEIAHNLSSEESLIEVHIALTSDSTTPSGYAWTSAKGSPFKLYSGTVINASVTLGQRHPINLIFAN